MIELNVMTVTHPKWDEFTTRLEGPEGCNFQRKNPKDVKSTTWKCSSGPGFELAKPILKKMGCDVEKSIAYFREHGGYCDCEVLFNVESSAKGRNPDGSPRRQRQRQRRRVSVKSRKVAR